MAADGADLDAIHPDQGSTALYLAALRGEKTMVSTLLEAGANPDAGNVGGLTGLGAAAHAGHADVLAMILDAGASVDLLNQAEETALFAAARAGHSEMVAKLKVAGADLRLKGKDGQTALHVAAGAGHASAAAALLDGGAFVNALDAGDYAPLHMAAGYGHAEVVQVLVDGGAELGLQSKQGLSVRANPIALARAAPAPDLCWLLRAGVQPLQLAAATQGARRKHEETVSALLAGGADLNQRDNTGGTVSSAEIIDIQSPLCSVQPIPTLRTGTPPGRQRGPHRDGALPAGALLRAAAERAGQGAGCRHTESARPERHAAGGS